LEGLDDVFLDPSYLEQGTIDLFALAIFAMDIQESVELDLFLATKLHGLN
tara:strand:- start:353 stop:502 length:150 start_codon:yes stop_codon:yes gene_type:complete